MVEGNTIRVQVINDPDNPGSENWEVINYPLVVDSDSPITYGSVGFTAWKSGDNYPGTDYDMQSYYSGSGGDASTPLVVELDLSGDAKHDGQVDGSDAAILANNWQVGVPPAAAVPEPSTMILLLIRQIRFQLQPGLVRSMKVIEQEDMRKSFQTVDILFV